jgi:colicin import membrane protein
MLIPWLLKYDGYPPGVVVALLLHGLLLYIFMPKQFDPADQVRIEPASIVVASAQQSPQRMRRLQQQTQRQQAEAEQERQRQREEQRKRDEAAAAERQRAEEVERRETERRRVAEEQEKERQREAEERQRVAQEQERERERQRQLQEQAAADAARRAQEQQNNAEAQSVEEQLVAQYVGIIKDLVSGAWSRPPSARNGMLAVVQLRLTPTGEIISSAIVQSSGDGAFDRSVLQAVDRVGNFSELQEMPTPIFERYFRNFNLEFRPEDLLR